MRELTRIASLGIISLAATGCAEQEPSRPNIIYILADDIGQECFGVYGGTYSTPRIDSLAQEGITYTNMHSMPLSCPSRVQTLTGRYNYKNYCAFGYMNPENTFATLAREAGYATAMVGKWQLGRSRDLPTLCGFDEWNLNQLEMYKEGVKMNGGTDRYANCYMDNNGHYEYSLYGPDGFRDYAFDFIDRQSAAGKPFLLFWTTPLVHTPHTPTPDSQSWDLDVLGRSIGNTENFPDMVTYLDKQVGQLVDKLKHDGLWDNTIVVFTADNGTSTRINSHMRDGSTIQGGKGTTTEYGTHVPLIITWGDKIKAPRTSQRLVDLVDFMPTFADAMGVEIPAEWDTDGISLYPEISGAEPLDREFTICHFNPCWPTTPSPLAARLARTARYKLYDDGRLIDAKADPLGINPIAAGQGSPEAEQARSMLQAQLDKLPAWTPDTPDAERRGNYGTFYDFAGPQNPF